MSHTNVRSTTANRRSRGRGRGNQQSRTVSANNNGHNNYMHSNNFQDSNLNSQRRQEDSRFPNNRGKLQNNRGHNNTNFKRGRPIKAYSTNSTSWSLNENNKIPQQQSTGNMFGMNPPSLLNHSQNPIFRDKVQYRFNSLLPKSQLLEADLPGSGTNPFVMKTGAQHFASKAPNFSRPGFVPAHDNFGNDTQTFASISNNIGYGFKNRFTTNNRHSRIDNNSGFDSNIDRRQQSNTNNRRNSSYENQRQHNSFKSNERPQSSTQRDKRNEILIANSFKDKPIKGSTTPQINTEEANSGNTVGNSFLGTAVSSLWDVLKTRDNSDIKDVLVSNLPNLINKLTTQDDSSNSFELPRPTNSSVPLEHGLRNVPQDNVNVSPNTSSHNPSTYNELGLTDGAFTGAMPYNIRRAAADPNERPATRSEALERFQLEYERKLVEHELKQREKEAKKREQYLARYKNVDQGHHLNEAYSDIGTRHANYLLSEEEVRERQQERLQQDAKLYQERSREEMDRKKKREEEKRKEWLEKQRHVDAGYRLGHGETQGTEYEEPLSPQQGVLPELPISPDLLLEGETIDDALVRQQEQLLVEAMIYKDQARDKVEMKKAEEVTTRFPKDNEFLLNEGYLDEAAGFGTEFLLEGESVSDILLQQQEQLLQEAMKYKEQKNTDNSKRVEENTKKTENSSQEKCQEAREARKSKLPPRFAKLREEGKLQKHNRELAERENNSSISSVKAGGDIVGKQERVLPVNTQPEQTESPQQETEDKEALKQRLLSQLETLINSSKLPQVKQELKPARSPTPSQETLKPASCVLNNPTSGPVLVLRKSEDSLNLTLAQRLEVQEEMDKHGTSAVYKPRVEEKPLYSNNRFERKPTTDATKAGTKPSVTPSKSPSPVCTSVGAKTVTPAASTEPGAGEPVIDYQTEMRLARLRMQQKYEESLRKQQETAPM